MTKAGVALSFEHVFKSFGDAVVLDDLNLTLHYGELIGILGPSGVGKSVLLRMAIGLEKPDSGRILYAGQDLTKLNEHEFFDIRRQISYVFQNGALFDSMTVEENLAYPLRLHRKLSALEVRRIVNERLALVGLGGSNELFPDELSGGMQKRVGLLRATMLDPDITLFDEPTSGLDPMNVRRFAQSVLGLKKHGQATGLFVTHDIGCAFAVCDHIGILESGRIQVLEPVELIRKSTDPMIRAFIDIDYGGQVA